MIERYSRPQMSKIWSNAGRFDLWLRVEIAVCESLAKEGKIPAESLATIKKKAGFDETRINEIEDQVHHDVIAFLTSVAEKVGPDSRYIHMGMTSSDLLDTAFAIQMRDAGHMILADIEQLLKVIKKQALVYKDTPMMGRSHGIHAEPITFGLKLAVWYSEFTRHLERMKVATKDISVGKISGAVGTFAHISPKIEKEVCENLGLTAAPVSTQIVDRDRHAHFFAVLAGIAASVEKVAVEIRHLERTEVNEVCEPFGKGQKGSSAMPHKRNPILCENLTGLARIVRANSMAAFENVALWHERDISHSSVERVIAPDSTILVDFMLSRLTGVVEGMEVHSENMLKNIERSFGLYNSQEVLLALIRQGMSREDAYKIVQTTAMQSWKEEKPFYDLLIADKNVVSKIDPKELKKLFDIEIHFKHVNEVFDRVFTRDAQRETRNGGQDAGKSLCNS